MPGMRLEFGVLGPLQASFDGTPLSLGAPKQRAVLAMLVINRNRPVGVDTLLNAAWAERPPPGARASLQTYVSALRRLLGTPTPTSRDVLVYVPPGYRLDVADKDCDIGRFAGERNAGMHEAAAGRFANAARHLSAALAQWRGPALEDLRDFQFAETFATALVEEQLVAHAARAESEIACGRAFAVIGDLEALVTEHPYREPLWAQLITAYYLAGRQSDALNAYQRLKTTLAEDLGIDPDRTVRGLHERILRQETLDVKTLAKTTAVDALLAIRRRTAVSPDSPAARLRDASGRLHPLRGSVTRIGRLPDNDIVLDDADVSRHHAIITDTGTGTSYVVTDLGSANGVEVENQRIHETAPIFDGDGIRIGRHEFTLEIPHEGRDPDAR
jgi:DNA-binding SARP family transcriptional activator